MNTRPRPLRPATCTARSRGFTLIEVMVVVVVIAILAAIAMPSYQEYVRRGWRNAARGALLLDAQFMARYYAQNLRYGVTSGSGANATTTGPTLPVTSAPEGGPARYTIALDAVSATAYTLTATPSGWTDSKCGVLSLDHLGNQTMSVAGATVADCWQR